MSLNLPDAKPAVTVRDIAKRLNLSVSTVSYALNGGPKSISEPVRNRVLELAKDLNYEPNQLARALVTGRTNVLGVVLPRLEKDSLIIPFVQLAVNGVVNAAEDLGQDVLLLTGADRTKIENFAPGVLGSRVDAIILIAPPPTSTIATALTERGIPFVVVAADWPVQGSRFEADNSTGISQAMDHLMGLGHRRIAHISGRENAGDATTRLEAYRSYVASRDLEANIGYVQPGDYTMAGGEAAMATLMSLPQPPTAVLCANDLSALGALIEAKRRGLNIPRNVSIVGFDDVEAAVHVDPPLTTVRQPVQLMANEAVRYVVSIVKKPAPVRLSLYATELMVRGTTGPAPTC